MSIGMIFSLFAPVGRFRELNLKLKRSREKREKLLMVLLFSITLTIPAVTFSQHTHLSHENQKPIHRIMSAYHSDSLASLLVQDFDGRIIPMHTLCDQLLRKIHRDKKYNGYNAVQTIMSMHMYPQFWISEKIIQVPSNLQDSLKVKNYCSFQELADQNGQFKWMSQYNIAHQKLESKRDEFDKKLIKLVEKFQVEQEIFSWQYLKIIPVLHNPNNTWFVPFSAELMQQDSISSGLALRYIAGLDKASTTNKYNEVTRLLTQLKKFQRKIANSIVPSERKVNIEIRYNKMDVFKNTLYSYMSIGFLLLVIFFIRIFIKPTIQGNRRFNIFGKIVKTVLYFVFIYHGVGLAFRWYISGHAPWSNGYEAVVFIAWVTMIAGFIFSSKNMVILAGTAILASLMIFVTEMNLLDPEITPLQPVLKSYWLMIHVAVITSSYGFLGLGAILGLINLALYIFRNQKNGQIVTLNINELTYVSEMTLTIGLFMLTI
jgi:ABC-type transport system involved in cytochrome c biogenesis permease subunit